MLDSFFQLTNKSHYPVACEQALCLGEKIARKGKGKFPARLKTCSQANYPADKYQGTQLHTLADRDLSFG